MSDKKYTPKEAAMAVLAKAAEIAKKHTPEVTLEKSGGQEINANSVAGAQGESMPPMNPMKMSEGQPPAQGQPQAQAPKGTKGHIKLAKFMGRMEHKRGGINSPVKQMSSATHDSEKRGNGSNLGGVSEAGEAVRESQRGAAGKEHGKESHKKVLGEMKQAPKPNLPS